MFYLYDPRTNILTETNYRDLSEMTGITKSMLATYKTKQKKLPRINCYFTDEKVTLAQRRAWYEKEKYPDEAWKPIKGSDNTFFVSSYGRFKRIYKNNNSKLLLPFIHQRSGHQEIKVMFKGKYGSFRISYLVSLHFIGVPKPNEVVYHKNLIKTDNFVGNLAYIHKSDLGKKTGGLSKSKPVVQLELATLEVINEFRSAREAGRQCYLSYQAVIDNCNRKSKTSGGYVFMWLEDYETYMEVPFYESY